MMHIIAECGSRFRVRCIFWEEYYGAQKRKAVYDQRGSTLTRVVDRNGDNFGDCDTDSMGPSMPIYLWTMAET